MTTSKPFLPMNLNEPRDLASLIEAFLLASGKPQSLERLYELLEEAERPAPAVFKKALEILAKSCNGRAFELKEVATGYRLQIREDFAPWVGRLWEERPQRYSRALLETLALIAYRQPITRGEIEDVRGVAVNSNIIKTLMEREWIRIVGYREVPGRPAMFATTKALLDHFNLKSLDELPALAELREMDTEPLLIRMTHPCLRTCRRWPMRAWVRTRRARRRLGRRPASGRCWWSSMRWNMGSRPISMICGMRLPTSRMSLSHRSLWPVRG